MRGALLVGLVALLGAAVPARAAGPAIPPPPTRWVTDGAGLMSPDARTRLDARLEAYQASTGHQVVVWIGDTLGGAPLDDWAVRSFAAWKVGRRGHDDGIAMFVFAQDRTIDIEVGYGLEGQVPDAIAHRIIDEVMAPRLRAGDADGAVLAGAEAILTAIEGKPVGALAPVSGGARPRQAPGPGQLVLYGLLGLALLLLFIFNPRLGMFLLYTIASGGRGGGGGGGGYSGGGGRSGGGGARGSW